MENAAEALKIAFAMLIFVIAITITFSLTSQAKQTADVVLYHSDKTNYYDHVASKEVNRKVSVDTVISTLYRYYKESINVIIVLGDDEERFDGNRMKDKKSIKNIETDLEEFVTNNLLTADNAGKMFTEEFVEAPIGGQYVTGDDGTQIIVQSGGKQVYVTYTIEP